MKLNQYLSVVLTGSLCLASASCALLDKSKSYIVRGGSGEVVEASASESSDNQVLTPPKKGGGKPGSSKQPTGKAVKNKKKKGKGKNQAVSKEELADARRDVAELENEAMAGQNPSSGDSTLVLKNALPSDFTINGEWTIYSVRGNVVTGEERPYINFDLKAKRFYGSNGCNIINGDLKLEPHHGIMLENMISTMRMCDDAPFEYLINLVVSDVRTYSARQEGPITFLDLKSADGNVILVLRRHNMDFLNGAWKVTEIGGTTLTPVEGEENATMTIDIPELKIHGTTGCNIFNGSLFIDPDKTDSMQFIDIVTTRMGCPPGAHETEFLLGLESVETAKVIGKDTIAMYDTEGKEIFKMTRIEYPKE